jgi:hypothetical protein
LLCEPYLKPSLLLEKDRPEMNSIENLKALQTAAATTAAATACV